MDQENQLIKEKYNSSLKEDHGKETIISNICSKMGIQRSSNSEEMAHILLENDLNTLEEVLEKPNSFNVNALEALLNVRENLNENFEQINPVTTSQLKSLFPEAYGRYFEKKVNLIFNKLQNNITKGIKQNIYREDLSSELLCRFFTSKLLLIHDPGVFPPHCMSFQLVNKNLFENFIEGIVNEHGLNYYKKYQES